MTRHPIAVVFALLLALTGCASSDPELVLAPQVDLARYAGRWYVIANIPYFAESGNVAATFDLSFEGDQLVDVYSARPASFDAPVKRYTLTGYIVPGTGNARWRETPLWPLYLSYLILYVDPEYRTALVGYPGRGYGWVLGRDPVMDDATYAALLERLRGQGYDISQFARVPQVPAQLGKPGFQ